MEKKIYKLKEYHFYDKGEVDSEMAQLITSRDFWKKEAMKLEKEKTK